MSYHGLGAGLNLSVNVNAGGGDGTSPSGCKTTQYGITGCDDCNKNANAYCCANHGGTAGKQSVDVGSGAFWADCKNGVRAARKAYGSPVQWFMPGTGMPPPPPPPSAPSGGLTGIAAALAAIQHQAQLSAWMGKMGKPAPTPASIKVIGGSGGNRPPAAGTPAAKSPVTGGSAGWNKGPTGKATGKVAGSGSGSGSQSSAPSDSLLADLNRAIGKASGVMTGATQGQAPAPSTPIVGRGPIVSTYEATPVNPTLPVEKIIDPPDAGWSTGQMIAVGVAALAIIGGAAYLMSQRSEHVLPRARHQYRRFRERGRRRGQHLGHLPGLLGVRSFPGRSVEMLRCLRRRQRPRPDAPRPRRLRSEVHERDAGPASGVDRQRGHGPVHAPGRQPGPRPGRPPGHGSRIAGRTGRARQLREAAGIAQVGLPQQDLYRPTHRGQGRPQAHESVRLGRDSARWRIDHDRNRHVLQRRMVHGGQGGHRRGPYRRGRGRLVRYAGERIMSYSIVQAAAGVGNTTLGCAGLGCGVIPGIPFAGLGATVFNPYATRTVSLTPQGKLVQRQTVSDAAAAFKRAFAPSSVSYDAGAGAPAEDDTLFYVGVTAAAAALLVGVWYFTQ